MFRKMYKEDFDSITPHPDVIDNLSEKLKSHASKKILKNRKTSDCSGSGSVPFNERRFDDSKIS